MHRLLPSLSWQQLLQEPGQFTPQYTYAKLLHTYQQHINTGMYYTTHVTLHVYLRLQVSEGIAYGNTRVSKVTFFLEWKYMRVRTTKKNKIKQQRQQRTK